MIKWKEYNRIIETLLDAWIILNNPEISHLLKTKKLVSTNINGVLAQQFISNSFKKWRQIDAQRLELEEWLDWIKSKTDLLLKIKLEWRPIIIIVSWWSSSWKTSKVSEELLAYYKTLWVSIVKISADSFFHGPTFMTWEKTKWVYINYDMPEAVNMELCKQKLQQLKDWKTITIPSYDFQNDPIADAVKINPAQIVIIEWMFTLKDWFYDLWDIRAFVDVSTHWRLIRRITRDSGKNWRTGKTPEQVFRDVMSEVEPGDDTYVKPQINNADIIISNDRNALIESVRIDKIEKQLKYQYNNIPFLEIFKVLNSHWFTIQKPTTHIDTFWEPIKGFWTEWEIFRIRESSEEESKLQLTYKFSSKNSQSRTERIINFPIVEDDINLIKPYYKEVWRIEKIRIKFKKWSIIIAIDTDVTLNDWLWMVSYWWNFIEIQWYKNEKELDIYKKIIELLTKEPWTNESYFDMLKEFKNI